VWVLGVKPEDCAQTLRVFACFVSLSFAGLVVLARSMNPIPSRTRPLNSSAPMVLWLKPWESRSLPGLPKTKHFLFTCHDQTEAPLPLQGGGAFAFVFRWTERCALVARGQPYRCVGLIVSACQRAVSHRPSHVALLSVIRGRLAWPPSVLKHSYKRSDHQTLNES
jgi:hypothetical protein